MWFLFNGFFCFSKANKNQQKVKPTTETCVTNNERNGFGNWTYLKEKRLTF